MSSAARPAAAKPLGGARASAKPARVAAAKAWVPQRQDPTNATNPFALAVGVAGVRKAGKTSYVLCHQPKSFDWRARAAKRHAQGRLADVAFAAACAMLNQIIGID